MKEVTDKELMDIQLSILCDIHQFCVKNNLKYFLAYGTLIGAIRHKGFIPWDDDIDIVMPRPDYEKFLKSYNGNNPSYTLISPEIVWNYYATYANVYDNRTILEEEFQDHFGLDLGVKIDIFPLDAMPNDEKAYIDLAKRTTSINNILRSKRWKGVPKTMTGKFKSCIKKIILKLYSVSALQKKLRKILLQIPYGTTNYVDMLAINAYNNTRTDIHVFDETILVPFEEYEFYAPVGYDSYLRNIYGDYMQLPPENKRIAHHYFKAYWKN